MKNILFFALLLVMLSCGTEKKSTPETSTRYQEAYRPAFHFSPAKNWTNDPNGPLFYDGEYHLFYQYNPYANTWGHMTWGHAVSKDLISWEHLPEAIAEYKDAATGDSTMIFSGTAVVDVNNTSGLCKGKDCLVAIYTSNVHAKGQGVAQHQSLAYSNDRGRTWTLYDKNPILDIHRKDFRDPKVFWYAPDKKWVMVLVVPDLHKVQCYESANLTSWKLMSEFGPEGDTTRIWECPDLYEVPVQGTSKSKWVLSFSGGHPQGPGFVGVQYFVGQFDGKKFTSDRPSAKPSYIDFGKDFYAAIVYNNLPAGKSPIMIAWANNWTYATSIPTTPWKGVMNLPRQLALKETPGGYQLIQTPLENLQGLRGEAFSGDISGRQLELEAEIVLNHATKAGVKILKSGEEETILGYNAAEGTLYLDRRKSGQVAFHKDFASTESVKVALVDGKLRLRIFIDHSLVEVFANDGEAVISDQVFPTGSDDRVETFADGDGTVTIKGWKLRSTWPAP